MPRGLQLLRRCGFLLAPAALHDSGSRVAQVEDHDFVFAGLRARNLVIGNVVVVDILEGVVAGDRINNR